MQIEKPSDLARIVKTRRQAQKLTQQNVANAAGITRQSLARIERGHAGASFDTVLRIFEELDIRLEAATKAQHPLAGSISAEGRTDSFDASALSAAAEASRNIDISALSAAAASAAAASRNIDTSALSAAAAAAAAASRNIDISALSAAAAGAAAAASRNIHISALSAAAAAASRNFDTSALLSSWRTALDNLTVQVQETAARTGTAIGAAEARKALLSAAIEAGDPDHEHSTTDEGLDPNKISDRRGNG